MNNSRHKKNTRAIDGIIPPSSWHEKGSSERSIPSPYNEVEMGLYVLGVMRGRAIVSRRSPIETTRPYIKLVLVLLLVVSLGLGLSNISYTVAYFSDLEATFAQWTTRSLDIEVMSTEWTREYCEPGNPVSKVLTVKNVTNHDLDYTITAHATGGSHKLCNALLIEAYRNDEPFYFGNITGFEGMFSLGSSTQDEYSITVSVPGYVHEKHIKKSQCEFDFILSSGQGMLPLGFGFFDTELDHNVIKAKIRGDNDSDDEEPKEPHDPKDPHTPKDPSEDNDPRDTKDPHVPKDKDDRDNEPKDPINPWPPRDEREVPEEKPQHDVPSEQDAKDPRSPQEPKGPQAPEMPKDIEHNEKENEHADNKQASEQEEIGSNTENQSQENTDVQEGSTEIDIID